MMWHPLAWGPGRQFAPLQCYFKSWAASVFQAAVDKHWPLSAPAHAVCPPRLLRRWHPPAVPHAPSHHHPHADDFVPDPFDPSAVELMRALSAKAKPAAHIYPFTMFSYK